MPAQGRTDSTLLSFENISFWYPPQSRSEPASAALDADRKTSELPILDGVSFSLDRGEQVALLGLNGSGKSTLARLANGLLVPTAGQVVADGINSQEPAQLLELRKCVGLVTQDPDNQIISTTVFDEIAFGPQNLGWEPARIYAVVHEAFDAVGLAEAAFSARDPNSLSGGEKQLVVLAALLAMQPNYLVLDEPTSMLDPKARALVLEAIAKAAEHSHGILHITHRLEEAAAASRVLILDRGRLVYVGSPQILNDIDALDYYELKATPQVKRHGYRTSQQDSQQDTQQDTQQDVLRVTQRVTQQDARQDPKSCLALEDVCFSYPDSLLASDVLTDIKLELKPGECLLLVGASGSGKSTLLRLAAGLMRPQRGRVLLDGKPPLPGQIGLVFQHPEQQLFAQTLKEDILFGPKNLKLEEPAAADALVDRIMELVGLPPEQFRDRSPFALSGGEARRAAIATTLALQTDYLLLDEPTASLDSKGRVFVFELLADLLAAGRGVVIATHDPDFFMPLATSVAELKAGCLSPGGIVGATVSDAGTAQRGGR